MSGFHIDRYGPKKLIRVKYGLFAHFILSKHAKKQKTIFDSSHFLWTVSVEMVGKIPIYDDDMFVDLCLCRFLHSQRLTV